MDFEEQFALLVERQQDLTRTVEMLAREHSIGRERQERADPDRANSNED